MTQLAETRIWRLTKHRTNSGGIINVRATTLSRYAVDFTERMNREATLTIATASNPALTIQTPTVSNGPDGSFVEFFVSGGLIAGNDYDIEVQATYSDSTVDSVSVRLRCDP